MAVQIHKRVVKLFPRKLITPVTGVLALVIGISGGMLFFHLGEGVVKSAHEWLGMLFVIVMLIHILSNWNAITQHFRQRVARTAALAVVLVTGLFLGSGAISQPGGPNLVYQALEEAPVTTLAQLFQVEEAALIEQLSSRGMEIENSTQTIQEAARLAGLGERQALKQLVGSVAAIR